MRAFNANVDLSVYHPQNYTYLPLDLWVQSIQVTEDNIGGLAVEFEADLLYSDAGLPYFLFHAEREGLTPESPKSYAVLTVRLDDQLVAIRGQLQLFRDRQFRSTFALADDQRVGQSDATVVSEAVRQGMEKSLMSKNPFKIPSPHPRLDLDKLVRAEMPVTVRLPNGELKTGIIRELRDTESVEGRYVGSDCYVEFDDNEGGDWFQDSVVRLAKNDQLEIRH